ncbi:hypothetical protein [Nitrobacter hamburgensis]|uniref:hypothetical protein n=1 Tax=Nitrobacter hamburgensis TaxID=912 RepID=UPI0012ED6F10|nr:hypothetical protein [Nitrobacter hamburgensis]
MLPMSPCVIQMPLSGGDRKHYARELRRVESLHAGLVKGVEAAHLPAPYSATLPPARKNAVFVTP